MIDVVSVSSLITPLGHPHLKCFAGMPFGLVGVWVCRRLYGRKKMYPTPGHREKELQLTAQCNKYTVRCWRACLFLVLLLRYLKRTSPFSNCAPLLVSTLPGAMPPHLNVVLV